MSLPQKNRAGFTLIEVMVAVAIMTVGTVGLLSMHQAALLANRAGRQMSQGTNITRTWIQRFKRDAFLWNTEGISGLSGTQYLSPLAATVDKTGWFKPEPADEDESWGVDWLGQDTRDSDDIRFCTHANLYWVKVGTSFRIDIRTFWVREGTRGGTASANFATYCGGGNPDTLDLSGEKGLRVIYASTVIRYMPRN